MSAAKESTQDTAPTPSQLEPMNELDAWPAADQMTPGINLGNTLENTTSWETGWGQPLITRELVENLARLGFKTVRVPVAWDTYAVDGQIQAEKLARVGEVVDFITQAGMFAVVNIHWDGGWIDSGVKEKYATPFVFSADAERKFPAYWQQIASFFARKNERVVFEALNEETNFSGLGSLEKEYATLLHVNQLFVDTVRKTGGNNARRLLIVAGHHTDFEKTCAPSYKLPTDSVPNRLFISVHYYTPYQFCGLTEDAPWGKMLTEWGSPNEVEQLEQLFDKMSGFCRQNNIPAFIGEFGVTEKKQPEQRIRWMSAVAKAAASRRMVPVLWDTGHDISRSSPYAPSDALRAMLASLPPRAVK